MNPDDYFPYSYWEQLSEEQQDNFLAYMKFLGVNSYLPLSRTTYKKVIVYDADLDIHELCLTNPSDAGLKNLISVEELVRMSDLGKMMRVEYSER